ncbi:MAG: hypothetical protein EOM20_17765 [Spartobacteria bacterium]|nr:hypothetical protein [Spartobacteria bacterium]
MKRIPIAEITTEMVLGEPVIARNGQVLLPQGAHLTERHTRILKTWGIRSIVIDTGDEEIDPQELSEELLERGRKRLKPRMLAAPHHTLEEQIYEVAVRRAAVLCREDDRNVFPG